MSKLARCIFPTTLTKCLKKSSPASFLANYDTLSHDNISSTASSPMYQYRADAPSRDTLAQTPHWVLLNFGTDWCGHCQAAQAAVSEFIATQAVRSEEHTSELQSRGHLVCRLLLEKKKKSTMSISSAKHIREMREE